MRRRVLYLTAALAAAIVAVAAGARPPRVPDSAREAGREPRLLPDYTGITLPPNIAPLNFVVVEPAARVVVRVSSPAGGEIRVAARDGAVRIPPAAWRRLLEAARGGELLLDVYAREASGGWSRFETVRNRVATEPVDGYVVYRLLTPIFNRWSHLGIYQRDLSTFRETPIVENKRLGQKCVNCHTFLNNRPDSFFFHTRSGDPAMVLVRDGVVSRVDTRTGSSPRPATYSAWHPGGKLIAFSFNRIRQFFHTAGDEPRDVVDLDSGIGVYDVEARTVIRPASTTRKDRLETFPTWSPDGRSLYYCSAPTPWAPTQWIPYEHVKKVRYDLMRIPFDPETRRFGAPETLLAAAAMGKSLLEPRISPDGRFLLLTACDYGSFPIHQDHSDLYLLDLRNPGAGPRRLDASPHTQRDSWHSWSSSGRWVVFSRKGDNRVLARPHLRYVDAEGRAAKAFVVPQEDPRFYDRFVNTYNAPELVTGPVRISARELARAASAAPLEKVTEEPEAPAVSGH